jgi:hypothetical protein
LPCLPWSIKNPNTLLNKAHITNINLNIFKTIEDVGLKIIASMPPLNITTSIPNFIKICPSVQKLLVGGYTQKKGQPFWNNRGHL